MKKTLTANISGTVFHIEEDAYDRLHRYLENIRSQFSGNEGRDEIMADIESRIAELFTERSDGRPQVVSIDDVEHVIGIMGQPEDYSDAGENTGRTPPPPPQDGRRRLFRDPADSWVGGVFGGLAAYIGTDPLWMRIAFILLVIFGVGSPILIYLVLWILIPQASTAAERLMMQGEPVTVDNLKRSFEEGAERMKQGAERVAREADELGRRWSRGGHRTGRGMEPVLARFLNLIGRALGLAFLVAGTVLILVVLGALIGGGSITYDNLTGLGQAGLFELGAIVFDGRSQAIWFITFITLLALIPAIGLLIGGVRLATDVRSPRWIPGALSITWVAALFGAVAIGARVGNDFSEDQTMTSEVAIAQPEGQTMYLDLHDMRGTGGNWEAGYSHGRLDWDMDGLRITDDSIHGAWARLDVVPSADSLFHLVVERQAHGRTEKMALARASHTRYTHIQSDSLMRFSPWVDMPRTDKLRAQMVKFVVQVPVGRAVHLNGGTGLLLHDVDNVSNTLDEDMVGRTWTMTRYGLNDQVRPEDVRDEMVPVEQHRQRSSEADGPTSAPYTQREIRTRPMLPDLLSLLRR